MSIDPKNHPELDRSMAVRFESLMEMYAPMDEDGVRHPGDGIISREDLLRLLDMPAGTVSESEEQKK